MAKILVIGDIHQKVGQLNHFLEKYESTADYTVFIGDYFDDFDDNVFEVKTMATWLRDNIGRSNRVFLFGNHDFQYMLPAGITFCSGYASWKRDIIEKTLSKDHWKQMKYFHAHESLVNDTPTSYWFSHAGITKHWFEHPVYGTTSDFIEDKLQKTQLAIDGLTRDWGCIWAADRFRGGPHKYGGLLWSDWRNIELFNNTTQIVGHTPHDAVQLITDSDKNAMCINVDTHMREVILLNTDTNTFDILSGN